MAIILSIMNNLQLPSKIMTVLKVCKIITNHLNNFLKLKILSLGNIYRCYKYKNPEFNLCAKVIDLDVKKVDKKNTLCEIIAYEKILKSENN